MQFSDPRKIDILEQMENPYSLDEYFEKCAAAGLSVHGTELEYAQKVGMVLYAKNKFKEKTPLEAYLLFMAGADRKEILQPVVKKEGCCGGGTVR